MSIKLLIRASFGFLLTAVIALALFQEMNSWSLRDRITEAVHDRMREQKLIADLVSSVTRFRIVEASHILTTRATEKDAREAEMTRIKQEIDTAIQSFAAGAGPSDQDAIAGFRTRWESYIFVNQLVLSLSQLYDSHATIVFLDQATELFAKASETSYREAVDLLGALYRDKIAQSDAAAAGALASLDLMRLLGGLAALLAVAIGALVIWRFDASVLRSLLALGRDMEALAGGRSDTEIQGVTRRDEIGVMARSVQVFKDNTLKVAALERQERAAAGDRLRRMDVMAAMVAEAGQVARAAAAGDFSGRMDVEKAGEDLRELGDSINAINVVVDQATAEFADIMAALAKGDLTQSVETAYAGRFGDLREAVNATGLRLSAVIAAIQTTARDVSMSAGEIALGADDLSQRTEQQASALEETAATTEELAASVKASAQASNRAVAVARDAKRVAESGGAIIQQAVAAMERIEQTSREISEVTSVIDGIAFQTNLLALNAAVEAARAGDAGKGFAVVASEVRALAQRSAEAAKNISGLIATSRDEILQGVERVRTAGTTFEQIVQSSQTVDVTVSDIAAAAQEQAAGIEEMSQAVAHLDGMTQQNAALSEESSALAETLARQTEVLAGLVSAFTTKTAGGGAAAGQPALEARRAA